MTRLVRRGIKCGLDLANSLEIASGSFLGSLGLIFSSTRKEISNFFLDLEHTKA